MRYILGREANEQTVKLPSKDGNAKLTPEQNTGLYALYAEADARADLGVGVIWSPQSKDGLRPSSIYAEGVASLTTAGEEMQAVANTQPRIASPVDHLIFSVSEAQSLEIADEQIINAARDVLDQMGYDRHQKIVAVHRDQPNVHVHVAVAVVNYETLAARPKHHYLQRLHTALRHTEIKFDLETDYGLATIRDRGLPTQRVEPTKAQDWAARHRERAEQRVEDRVRAFLSDESNLETEQIRTERIQTAMRDYLASVADRGEKPLRSDIHVLAARFATTIVGPTDDGKIALRVMERPTQATTTAEWKDSYGERHLRHARWVPTDTVLQVDTAWVAPSPADGKSQLTRYEMERHVRAMTTRQWLSEIGDVEVAEREVVAVLAEDPSRVSRDIIASGKANFTAEDIDRWTAAHITDEWSTWTDRVLREDTSLRVLSAVTPSPLYTTEAQQTLTHQYVELARELMQAPDPTFDPVILEKAITDEQEAIRARNPNATEPFAFTPEQLGVFRRSVERRLSVVQGESGVGKSVTMSVQRRYYESLNRHVAGFATAQKAAEVLGQSAGIASVNQTRAVKLEEHAGREMIADKSHNIIDEGSLFSIKAAYTTLLRVKQQGATAIVIGDLAQLPNIEAGNTLGILENLADKMGRLLKLTKVFRQSGDDVGWMRDWVPKGGRAIRTGNEALFRDYLTQYIDRGHVVFHKDRKAMVDGIAADIVEAVKRGVNVIAPSYSKADVLYVNLAVKTALGFDGIGTKVTFDNGERELSAGVRVVFTKNAEKNYGVLNGYTGTIVSASPTRVSVDLDNGRRVSFDPRAYTHVDYGWSATTHKYQGTGSPLVIASLTKSDDARSAHVALTRCESGLRVHTMIPQSELVSRLSSERSLAPKDDAVLFERIVQQTGGKDTPWAKAVKKAAHDDADPLRQDHRAEMTRRRTAMQRDIFAGVSGAVAAQNHPLESFVVWAIHERERLEVEWENKTILTERHAQYQSVNVVVPPVNERHVVALRTVMASTTDIANTSAAAYLASRGIHSASAAAWHSPNWTQGIVTASDRTSLGYGPAAVFGFFDRDRALVAAQGRFLSPPIFDGSPLKVWTVGSVARGVFATAGAWEAQTVAVCEAPIDALSLAELGLPAFALGGTANVQPLLRDLLIGRSVIAAMDADPAGRKATDALAHVLGGDATFGTLTLPAGSKDVNEALLSARPLLESAVTQARGSVVDSFQEAWVGVHRDLGLLVTMGIESAVSRHQDGTLGTADTALLYRAKAALDAKSADLSQTRPTLRR